MPPTPPVNPFPTVGQTYYYRIKAYDGTNLSASYATANALMSSFLDDFSAGAALDTAALATFPEGYRHLAYIQTRIGYQVKMDMPMLKGPVVNELYQRGARWLAGSELER